MATDGQRLLSLREVAEQMGMSPAQLRELARQGKLPASKHAGRWLVEAADLPAIQPLRRVSRRPIRGRLAQTVALDHMTNRLLHHGATASEPNRSTPARPASLSGKAHVAQGEALEHLEERLQQPHPPERSI